MRFTLLTMPNFVRTINPSSFVERMASSKSLENNLVWIDLEMTGLHVKKDKILEIACIITNANLDIIATGPNIVIHESDEVLNSMNDWCKLHHKETGLIEDSRASKIDVRQAETQILTFIKKYCPENACPLAGNSVYMDRLFLMEHMPTLDAYLHYRIVDVSSVKELCKRWNQTVYQNAPNKKLIHRALDDIEESVKELKYYRQFMFNLH